MAESTVLNNGENVPEETVLNFEGESPTKVSHQKIKCQTHIKVLVILVILIAIIGCAVGISQAFSATPKTTKSNGELIKT